MIDHWNVCLSWVGITNSVIPDQIVPWEAGLLELTLFDQCSRLWVHFHQIWIELKIRT